MGRVEVGLGVARFFTDRPVHRHSINSAGCSFACERWMRVCAATVEQTTVQILYHGAHKRDCVLTSFN